MWYRRSGAELKQQLAIANAERGELRNRTSVVEAKLATSEVLADVGQLVDRPKCTTLVEGKLWIDQDARKVAICVQANWRVLHPDPLGGSEYASARSCRDVFEDDKIAEARLSWIGRGNSAAERVCEAGSDKGGDGSTRAKASAGCEHAYVFWPDTYTEGIRWVTNSNGFASQVYCDAAGKETGDGSSEAQPALSCAHVWQVAAARQATVPTDGYFWIGGAKRYCTVDSEGAISQLGSGESAEDPAATCDLVREYYAETYTSSKQYHICRTKGGLVLPDMSAKLVGRFNAGSNVKGSDGRACINGGTVAQWGNMVPGGPPLIASAGKPRFVAVDAFAHDKALPTIHLYKDSQLTADGVTLGLREGTVIMVLKQTNDRERNKVPWMLTNDAVSYYVHAP